jgi:hypothetical protein
MHKEHRASVAHIGDLVIDVADGSLWSTSELLISTATILISPDQILGCSRHRQAWWHVSVRESQRPFHRQRA